MFHTLQKQLEHCQENNLYRQMKTIYSASGPRVIYKGRETLMLASNNYLGLANDPRLRKAAISAIKRYGTGSSGSRLTTGNLTIHRQLEEALAQFKGTEDALLFSSGYMANVGTLAALGHKGSFIFSDELNHASIIDGCRLSQAQVKIYHHNDLNHLEALLSENNSCSRRLIVTDGVFSMDGDMASLAEIVQLAQRYGAMVMVDDAHGTGVLGKKGTGTVEYFGLGEAVDIQVGTLSKALGGEGGFIAGKKVLIDFLRNYARSFIFSTAPSPGVVGAALAALKIVREEPERRKRLFQNACCLHQKLLRLGLKLVSGETQIIAVLIGSATAALTFSQKLEEHGVFVPAIRPPSVPEGMSRLRVTVMSEHTPADLGWAEDAFQKVSLEVKIKEF